MAEDTKGRKLPVYLLAGGRSSRFGSDKAQARLAGEPLIVGVARALEPFASRVTVVAAREGEYDALGLRTIADREPGLGPIGGLRTALEDLQPGEDRLLLAACDWTGLQGAWIEQLIDASDPDHDAVLFKGERWEPLLGIYRISMLPLINRNLDAGRRAMQTLADEARTRALDAPPDWRRASNVNTPEDLMRATDAQRVRALENRPGDAR